MAIQVFQWADPSWPTQRKCCRRSADAVFMLCRTGFQCRLRTIVAARSVPFSYAGITLPQPRRFDLTFLLFSPKIAAARQLMAIVAVLLGGALIDRIFSRRAPLPIESEQ